MDGKNIANKIKSEFTVNKFLGKLFTLRTVAHLYHLNVTGDGSYAKHRASGELYEELSEQIDSFIESYQGKYGIVKNIVADKSTLDKNFIVYLKEMASYVESSQNKFKETWLQNQIDEISTLMYTILYKLNNLS